MLLVVSLIISIPMATSAAGLLGPIFQLAPITKIFTNLPIANNLSTQLSPHLQDLTDALQTLTTSTTSHALRIVRPAMDNIFTTISGTLRSLPKATGGVVHNTLHRTQQSTHLLLDAVARSSDNGTHQSLPATSECFARNALDVKTLMHATATGTRTAETATPTLIHVLSHSLAVVHSVSNSCAQRLRIQPSMMEGVRAIGAAAAATDRLAARPSRPRRETTAQLHAIVGEYSRSVHAVTAPLGQVIVKGRRVNGPGPELKLRGPVYGEL